MSPVAPRIKELALELLSFEVADASPSNGQLQEAVRVCERLRVPFSRLAGGTGFASLLSRSLTLARAEAPLLHTIHVQSDGTLVPTTLELKQENPTNENVGVALVARLLELLVTLIGEPLTLTLMLDAWPGETFDRTNIRAEEKS